jgi:hypothetical protein
MKSVWEISVDIWVLPKVGAVRSAPSGPLGVRFIWTQFGQSVPWFWPMGIHVVDFDERSVWD